MSNYETCNRTIVISSINSKFCCTIFYLVAVVFVLVKCLLPVIIEEIIKKTERETGLFKSMRQIWMENKNQ